MIWVNKEEYIFPTDCSKENIRYLLDIGCKVIVTITYKRSWEHKYHTDTCEIRYSDFMLGRKDKLPTDVLKIISTSPEYFWDHYDFPLYIYRNDLL